MNMTTELAEEWSDKNLPLTPAMVTAGSHKKVYWKGKCGHEWQAIVKNRVNGSGCPYCAGNKVLTGFNDLASQYPDLAKEWSEKNGEIVPEHVTTGSNYKVWWRCKEGHEWKSRVADRVAGSGCPYCSGTKLLPGFNDLKTKYPEITMEWSDQNNDLKPETVSPLSHKNVWWKCAECGYEWRAVIYSRVKGQKCPACAGRAVALGVNDLATTDSEIAAEWHPDKNGDMLPNMFLRTSSQRIWWLGKCGHEWSARIDDRSMYGATCPVCEKAYLNVFYRQVILFYADTYSVQAYTNYENMIGVSLEIYFPDSKIAVEFSKASHYSMDGNKWERSKNRLCLRAGIRMIRILDPDAEEFGDCICIKCADHTEEAFEEAVTAVFKLSGVEADINLSRDSSAIKEFYSLNTTL